MPPASSDRDRFRQLLRAYDECPEQRASLAAQIDQEFGRTLTVLVIDSLGFSRATRLKGIVHALAVLGRLERLVRPVIERYGGRLLRTEADTSFVVFPDTPAALRCAEAILDEIGVANELLPDLDDLCVAMGIGYGRVLVIGSDDLYGDEMNLACKLGEDLAHRGEILLTAQARAALGETDKQFETLEFTVSGLDVPAYRLIRE